MFSSLQYVTDISNIKLINADLQTYIHNLSALQRRRRYSIICSKTILYYTIFLQISNNQKQFLKYPLYNIWATDYNQYDGDGGYSLNPNASIEDLERYQLIKNINNTREDLSHCSKYFCNTFNIIKNINIENFDISLNFLFLKNNATIHPHSHNKNNFAFHVLLENLIENEECKLTVNNKHIYLQNVGDSFLFNTFHLHSFNYKGNGNTLLSICITPKAYI